ncbi:MAG: tol-pal system-associated acyl-CoA thioesterase [Holosporales bacterium]|jgi:acyl-CoA thioester hydrolase|nr:tol-pal system-associated acyl-CoA thioesterase [Holosporales bacterium]
MDSPPHRFSFRVYYEDTDAGGIVYYANYLRFTERARTEFLRAQGIHQRALAREEGLFFVVAQCQMHYIAPAYLEDWLEVTTTVNIKSSMRLVLQQDIFRNEDKIFTSLLTLACVNAHHKACQFPEVFDKICI